MVHFEGDAVLFNDERADFSMQRQSPETDLSNFYEVGQESVVLEPGREYTMPSIVSGTVTVYGDITAHYKTFEFYCSDADRDSVQILERTHEDASPKFVGEVFGREGVIPIGRNKEGTSDLDSHGLAFPYSFEFSNISRQDGNIVIRPGFGEDGKETFTLTYERDPKATNPISCEFESRRLKK